MARPGEDFALSHSHATATAGTRSALAMRDKGQTPGRYDLEPASQANGGDLTFSDLVDVINPLQHIPGVSTIYRELTGDEISAPARLAGGTLYFGPIGLAAAAVNVFSEATTGKDIGEHVAALFDGDDTNTEIVDAAASTDTVLPGGLSVDEWLQSPAPGAAAFDPAALEDELPDAPKPDRNAEIESGVPQAAPPVLAPAAARSASTAPEPAAHTITGAVPVEALPADILAALMGDGGVRPIQTSAGLTNADASPVAGDETETAARRNGAASATPGNGGLSGLQPPLMPNAVAYNEADAFGAVANDGGWFAQAMNDALSRYQDSAGLRQEAQKVYVDVAP